MDDEIIYRKKKMKPGEVVALYNIHVQKRSKFKNKDRTADNTRRNINSEIAANPPAVLAVRSAKTERCVCLGRSPHVFLKSGRHFKILRTWRENLSKFHPEDPQILRATVHNSDTQAT